MSRRRRTQLRCPQPFPPPLEPACHVVGRLSSDRSTQSLQLRASLHVSTLVLMAPWPDKPMPGVLRAALMAVQAYAFYYACSAAYNIRLHAVTEYGRIIHEFDPWSASPLRPAGAAACLPRARAFTRTCAMRACVQRRGGLARQRLRAPQFDAACLAGCVTPTHQGRGAIVVWCRFNFRATKYLWENGWTKFFHWCVSRSQNFSVSVTLLHVLNPWNLGTGMITRAGIRWGALLARLSIRACRSRHVSSAKRSR